MISFQKWVSNIKFAIEDSSNANFSSSGNGFMTPSSSIGMDCDTGQQDVNSQHSPFGAQEGKQYSLLQNACMTYGINLKEEDDYKIQSDLLSSQYGQYDVTESGMMVDMMTGAVVDPLQFTATLTFSSPSEQSALFESFGDNAELFLPRLSADDTGNDLLEDSLRCSPSSTGSVVGQDGQIATPVEPSVDPFPEHGSLGLTRGFDTSRFVESELQMFGSAISCFVRFLALRKIVAVIETGHFLDL